MCCFHGVWDLPSREDWKYRCADNWEEHLHAVKLSQVTEQYATAALIINNIRFSQTFSSFHKLLPPIKITRYTIVPILLSEVYQSAVTLSSACEQLQEQQTRHSRSAWVTLTIFGTFQLQMLPRNLSCAASTTLGNCTHEGKNMQNTAHAQSHVMHQYTADDAMRYIGDEIHWKLCSTKATFASPTVLLGPVLFFQGGIYFRAINNPVQQLVSKKGGWAYFRG